MVMGEKRKTNKNRRCLCAQNADQIKSECSEKIQPQVAGIKTSAAC